MEIRQIFDLDAMHTAYRTKDIETLLSFYAKNATVVQILSDPKQKNEFKGHKAIKATYEELFEQIVDYEYFDEILIISENIALFTFQWAELEKGKRISSNYASWVLQKESEGNWLILIDTYRC